jgi:hypothetical protein
MELLPPQSRHRTMATGNPHRWQEIPRLAVALLGSRPSCKLSSNHGSEQLANLGEFVFL